MVNLQNKEISNDRQERNEHRAEWESKAETYLRSKLDNDEQLINKNKSQKVRCPKVPPILRNEKRSKEYYDPKIVSFGPYHHGKAELRAAETIKRQVMQKFILGHGKTIKDLYIKVLELNDYARRSYVDGSTDDYDDEAFALMMLQDGCFILAWIEGNSCIMDYLDNLELCCSYLDTFLLENQIPFKVLNVLMSNIYNENKGLESIKSILNVMHWGTVQKHDTPDEDEPANLLELQKRQISKRSGPEEIVPKIKDFISSLPSFGSVSDLQAKGINFKPSNSISLHPAEKEKPKSISLRDVEFRSGFFTGELILPPLFLTPDALVYYRNLIASEICDGKSSCEGFIIASYISFMNSLIANPEDVKVLRSKRIILHTLNSDEEVFKMLKEISGTESRLKNLFIYQGVRQDIEKHYNSKKRIWIAEIRHKYFNQPWSIFGLLAAVVAIILSFLQTFYTIHPRKG